MNTKQMAIVTSPSRKTHVPTSAKKRKDTGGRGASQVLSHAVRGKLVAPTEGGLQRKAFKAAYTTSTK